MNETMRARLLKRAVVGGLLCLAAFAAAADEEAATSEPDGSPNGMFNAVVKLEVVMAKADPIQPWQSISDAGTGSGVVIAPGRILTCAHCVTDATYIRIRKHSEDSFYKGAVEFIDNDCDLALVKVADPAFMRDVAPMALGATPVEQDHVLAVGYPLGGDGVSFTEGVVSRVESVRYSHSLKRLLAIQVDAAINPGNSGGPVLDVQTGRICGIAFQGNKSGEALGYLIPPDVIRHFLRDIEDGVVNGFCDMFFSIEELESEAARRYYGMSDEQTGIRVCHVASGTDTNSLAVGDILLEVEGYRVANNGNIRISGNRRRSWQFPLTMKQIGESVQATILRDGKVVRTQLPVQKRKLCIRGFLYDRKPDYFVFGGFAFSTVSYDFLKKAEKQLHTDVTRDPEFEGEEDVAIVNILSDDCIEGYLGVGGALVRSFNGERVKNLKHLVELVENCRTPYVRFGLDDGDDWELSAVLETAKMREATASVLRTYQIPADRR